MAAPPAGTRDYDGDLALVPACSTWCATRSALVSALGYRSVAAVVGHDFGSPVAAWCALVRPDVFRSVVLMSAPFAGPPRCRSTPPTQPPRAEARAIPCIDELAALPRPRKHYQWYYSTREANADMRHAPQGVHDFLRAYYHHKSADWKQNQPYPLQSWTAGELAKLPTYYVMDLAKNMAETVAAEMPSAAADRRESHGCPTASSPSTAPNMRAPDSRAACNGIAAAPRGAFTAELQTFSGRSIDVPSCFIAGKQDWGIYQRPGDFERCRTAPARTCSAAIWSTAPATGCSRSSRRRSAAAAAIPEAGSASAADGFIAGSWPAGHRTHRRRNHFRHAGVAAAG